MKRKKLTKLIGVVFPTGSHDDTVPIYIIAKIISSKTRNQMGFQHEKKTVFVAYQYLNNHNHGQIYIQSSQGAAANNSISCHRNIKHPRNNHSICYIFLCFVHEFVLINSNYVLLYFTLCIRNVNASVSVKTLMYQVCHSTYSNQSGSLLTLLGLKSSEQNQSVFASKCCRASGSKR